MLILTRKCISWQVHTIAWLLVHDLQSSEITVLFGIWWKQELYVYWEGQSQKNNYRIAASSALETYKISFREEKESTF